MPENIDAFTTAFENEVTRTIREEQLIPEIIIDEELQFSDIKPGFYNIIKQMEPFGPENMRPVFVSKKVSDTGFSKIVKDQHIRLVAKQNDTVITGIFFRSAHLFPIVQNGKFDIVYTIDENDWNGTTSLQLKVIDIRPSTD
jgi:single-stranded-DNA-specific exonuclease